MTDSALHHPLFSKLPLVYALLIKGSAKNCPSPTYLPVSHPTPNPPTHTQSRKTAQAAADEEQGASSGGSRGGPNDRQTKRKGHRGGKNERGSNPSELHWLSGSLWSCYTLCHPNPPPPIAAGNYDRDTGERGAVCDNFNWSTGCRV